MYKNKLFLAGNGGAYLYSQHLRGRQISQNLSFWTERATQKYSVSKKPDQSKSNQTKPPLQQQENELFYVDF